MLPPGCCAPLEQLAKGFSPVGGMSWRKSKRDFVNAAATAPTALAYVRAGDPKTAAALMDWMNETLWDAERSLYIDGVNVRGDEYEYERWRIHLQPGNRPGRPAEPRRIRCALRGGPR